MEGCAMADKVLIGVDVSKGWLDAWDGQAAVRVDNEASAIAAWLGWFRPLAVAFEPTGGHERRLVAALRERGILFVRVHPNDVVAFRKSRGIKAKTDRIDAALIHAFLTDLSARRPLCGSIIGDDRLRALAARRRQLVGSLHAETCRLELATEPLVRDSIEAMIELLRTSLDRLQAALSEAIAADPSLAELMGLLRTIYGIGPVVAATLIADLPELGLLSGKEIAALVGLAPQTRQSGKQRYREPTGHGRPGVRQALFNAARAAISRPSPFRAFYDRLVNDNHRPGLVALTAVMRKILVAANAVARDRQPWNPTFKPAEPEVGTSGRSSAKPSDQRADRVKAKAAPSAGTRSASLEASGAMSQHA
jgi:transposase